MQTGHHSHYNHRRITALAFVACFSTLGFSGCASLTPEKKTEIAEAPAIVVSPVAKPMPAMPPLQGAKPIPKKPATLPKKKVTTAGEDSAEPAPVCQTARDGRRYTLDGKVRLYAPCQ